jgi:N-acetylmuramoyl-L-alanine amidase
MRSFGRALVVGVLLLACSPALRAQESQSAALLKEAGSRETALRRELDALQPGADPAPLLRRVRILVGAYEDMWRLFPTSGYSDNALWQGATLSADVFWQFGEAVDRTTALRMLQTLTTRFPTSSLVKNAPPLVKRLEAARPSAASTTAARSARPGVDASLAPATAPALLRSVRREVLGDAVRITLELQRETGFRAERQDSTSRLLIELLQTRPVDALTGATLTFPDDVVRQVRVGLPQAGMTRLVFDLQGARRYSVYALYNPYRVVIDFERAAPGRATPAATASKTTRLSAAAAKAGATRTSAVAATASTEARARQAVVTRPPLPARVIAAGWTAFPPVAPRNAVAEASVGASAALARPAGASAKPRAGGHPVIAANGAVPPVAAVAPSVPSANASGGFSLSRQLGLGVARIVIDAGHGGRDPGAKVKGLNEADLVLDVALKLEKLLAKQPGFEVVLTRRTDTFVPLEERTAMANRADADLFLSIHANASANTSARGIETYFLNFAPNPEAEAIAARENVGSSRSMRHLPDIVRAIALNNKIDESRDFAAAVQSSLYERLRKPNHDVKNLGVKQAPFMVLIGATMPSVLAEISFLTNGPEGRLLRTDKYRQQIADALLAGIIRYQQSLKRVSAVAEQ